mgnify:CR=1 FL=1
MSKPLQSTLLFSIEILYSPCLFFLFSTIRCFLLCFLRRCLQCRKMSLLFKDKHDFLLKLVEPVSILVRFLKVVCQLLEQMEPNLNLEVIFYLTFTISIFSFVKPTAVYTRHLFFFVFDQAKVVSLMPATQQSFWLQSFIYHSELYFSRVIFLTTIISSFWLIWLYQSII